MEARNRTGGHSGGPMGTLMGHGYLQGRSRLRGAHSLGRVGSLGSREGSVPSQGQAPLGAPVTAGGRREEAWLELPWGGPGGLTGAQRQGGSRQCVHRGSPPKLLLLFLRLALVKGMSRDSRRKGRGWGSSGAGAGGMVEPPPSGGLRPGELRCAEEKRRRETRRLARMLGGKTVRAIAPARGPGPKL